MDEQLFVYLAAVPVLGVVAQWIAWRIKLPSILVLLTVGIVLGRIVRIDDLLIQGTPNDPVGASRLLFPIVSLSVAIILFEGGMSLRFRELHEAGWGVVRLITVSALISWGLTAALAWSVLGLDYRLAILLGAILVVTGPTVVQPLLRHIRPTRRVSAILKWEGIVIDPIGAMLAVVVFEQLLSPERIEAAAHATPFSSEALIALQIIFATIGLGSIIGAVIGLSLILLVSRFLIPDHLHGVAFLAAVFTAFAVSNLLVHESGLVAVTVLGILLANQRRVPLEHVLEFKENLGVFLISCLFIVLGSRLDLNMIANLGWRGVVFLLGMIVLVRPVSVIIGLLFSKIPPIERLFVAALAPRGIVAAAVASIFALKVTSNPELATLDPELVTQADQMVSITFLVIVGTVLIYGLTAAPLARRLKLADADPQGFLVAGAEPWVQDFARVAKRCGLTVSLVDTNYRNISNARMNGLTAYCASVLSEEIREGIDLAGVGRFLAMTGNDEVNTLAVREFEHLFGRANVYRLPANPKGIGPRSASSDRPKGRELFGEGLSQRAISTLVDQGYEIRATTITDTFTYQDFLNGQGEFGHPLIWVDGQKRATIATTRLPLKPTGRGTVIALVPKKTRAATNEKGTQKLVTASGDPEASGPLPDEHRAVAEQRIEGSETTGSQGRSSEASGS